MRAVSLYATAVVTAAMLAPWMGAYAQDSKLSVPNVTVTAQGRQPQRSSTANMSARPRWKPARIPRIALPPVQWI